MNAPNWQQKLDSIDDKMDALAAALPDLLGELNSSQRGLLGEFVIQLDVLYDRWAQITRRRI